MIQKYTGKSGRLAGFVDPLTYVQHAKKTSPVPYRGIFLFQRGLFHYAQNEWPSQCQQNEINLTGGVGAPATILALEELFVRGMREFICLGTAGAIHSHHSVADVLVVESALRDEGTSSHYGATDVMTTASLKLQKEIIGLGNWKSAMSWTTDAPYRETKEEIEYYSQQGIAVVEMEASAIYAWAQFRQVEAIVIVVVSDLLYLDRWQPHFTNRSLTEKLQEVLKTLIFKK